LQQELEKVKDGEDKGIKFKYCGIREV